MVDCGREAYVLQDRNGVFMVVGRAECFGRMLSRSPAAYSRPPSMQRLIMACWPLECGLIEQAVYIGLENEADMSPENSIDNRLKCRA